MREPNCDEVLACSASDLRADGGVRAVWLTPRGVRIERAVSGIKMSLTIPIEAYRAILSTCQDGDRRFCRITLAHRDPDLSVTLDQRADAIPEIWESWARFFSKPAHAKAMRDAVAQPRRRSKTVANRRPRILLRRRPGRLRAPLKVFPAARELFSWE
jgi:hypothetical protein